ncbi:MAG: hotdog fold thioesterase [Alphaproteobacteria bacterium]|jgi:1,4-dihydroxy-2-naphthoyl-CoA hydrolase|nr:hotdog fold thioesterase [Alphaproteobacteria bacterium]MCB1551973.1 hotdog fold thioesterase [Alphaproteobacteria bacterium]MCB9984946.1 hotdog fold thioesterase [Micavibrio sp.]HPQ50874.1 hotdog fold thioesterase [Alphaproteobacteria bacterium]HRK97337.1 hotdog fold thioesterase [Alphaproteobacteria bacterium]
MIWFKPYMLETLEGLRNANMGQHVGFEFIEVGEDFLSGRLPVDYRTTQPFGILHGGASCVLSETLGSVAAWMTIDPDKYRAVGLEINCNHIRAVTEGFVIGVCTPLHVGRRTQVWQTDMTEEATGKRVAISRLTVSIIDQGTLSTQKEVVHVR